MLKQKSEKYDSNDSGLPIHRNEGYRHTQSAQKPNRTLTR